LEEIMMKSGKLLTMMVVSSFLCLLPSICRSQASGLSVFGMEVGNTWTFQGTYQGGAAQIKNPSFEAGTTGWAAGSTSGASYTFTVDNTDAYDGTEAAKLTVMNDGYCQISNQEPIPILRSGPYTLRLYAKVVGSISHLSIAAWKATAPGVFPTTPVGYMSSTAFGLGYELYELPIHLYSGDYLRFDLGIDNNASGTSYVLFDKLKLVNPESPYVLERMVVRTDPATFSGVFSGPAYVVEERSHGITDGGWYQVLPGEVRLWGIQDGESADPQKFSAGLTVTWFPVAVGENRHSTATTSISGYPFNVVLSANVEAKERVSVGFDTLEAYKVGYQLRTWNTDIGYDATESWYHWMVPYLGIIKYQDSEATEVLASFAIGAGTISRETDADHDGLKDYREILHGTDWHNDDTDGDGMTDGWEVEQGLNPLFNDASGDKDGDGYTNLREYMAGTDPADPVSKPRTAPPWVPLLLDD
jgi:hypothetical protein